MVASVGLLALPAGAWQLEPGDRGLLHAYSPEALELLWSTLEVDEETACEIQEGEQYTYRTEDEDVTIISGENEIMTDDCSLTATDVTGPQGQVNHGTVVSSFVQALKDAGYQGRIGCYVSAIARTDYGKGDQQIKTPDVTTSTTTPPEGTEEVDPTVEFTITATNCKKSDGDETENEGETGGGPPEWVQDKKEGKSDAAREDRGKGKPDWAGQPGPPPHAKGGKP